jgi:hypothetical protein
VVAPAAAASAPTAVGVGGFPAGGEFSGDLADGLDQLLGHPADGGEYLAERETGEDAAPLLNPVFAFAGGPFFEGVIHFMADPAGFLDGLAHGKNEAGNGNLRPLRKMEALDRMVTDSVAAAGFAEVGLAFARVNEDNGDFGLMSVPLADHLGGGTELAGGAIDGGGGTESAELELKDGGGVAVGKGDGIQLSEAVAAAEMVAQFRVLVPEDAAVAEFEVAGEKGADPEFGGGTNDGEGGGLDADLADPLPFPSAADGKALRPAQVFAVVRVDEFRFAVIGGGGGGVRIQAEALRFFWRRPRNKCRRCRG